jgi:hypothetical protein
MTRLVFQASPHYLEGKNGVLQKNDKGHYKLLMGMYNAPNCMGDVYILSQKVKQLFVKSTAASWCADGRLFGEADHPGLSQFMMPGRSTADAVAMLLDRSATVPVTAQNHQIHKFWYEEMAHKVDGQVQFGVYGELEPLTNRMRTSLDNPNSNTSMSVRSFVGSRSPTGIGNYLIEQSDLLTWDEVSVPGLKGVGKYNSVGFESHRSTRIELSDEEHHGLLITPEVINSLREMAVHRGGFESDCHLITQMVKDDNGKWLESENLAVTLASRAWARSE